MISTNELKRGQVVMVDLGDAIGSEQKGTRPCVIISNNIGNKHSHVVTIAPLSSKIKLLPTHVKVDFFRPSMVMLEHIRTIDKNRIILTEGTREIFLTDDEMKKIDAKILIALGLN